MRKKSNDNLSLNDVSEMLLESHIHLFVRENDMQNTFCGHSKTGTIWTTTKLPKRDIKYINK